MPERSTANRDALTDLPIGSLSFGPPARHAEARRSEDLHVCPACSSVLVHPTDWAPAGPGHWAVNLRCPSCEWRGAGIFEQDVVDRFDEELDRGAEALLCDLTRLTRANMEEHARLFATALAADGILPEDF